MPDTEVNWKADIWFTNHRYHDLTDEFKVWWISYYGPPSDYDECDREQDEYWCRCGFALTGWLAAKKESPAVEICTPVASVTRKNSTD